MKKISLFVLFYLICSAGFSENPRWKKFGTPIPARANLDVRWEISPTNFPPEVWIYRLLPNTFSSEIISNVMNLCGFRQKDKIEQSTNGMIFQSADGSRRLSISFPSANIHYEIKEHDYGPTNLAIGVPEMRELPELATNILANLHISSSDITGYFGTNKLEFYQPLTEYFVGHTIITNIEYRTVYFRRSVDGIPIVGGSSGFNFGEHGKICKISITWHNLKRYKLCRTLTPQAVIRLLRQGKAHQGLLPMGFDNIDWSAVKSVTIKYVWPSYYSGATDWLYPYLALWTTVEAPRGTVDVEIDCPIIDESKR